MRDVERSSPQEEDSVDGGNLGRGQRERREETLVSWLLRRLRQDVQQELKQNRRPGTADKTSSDEGGSGRHEDGLQGASSGRTKRASGEGRRGRRHG